MAAACPVGCNSGPPKDRRIPQGRRDYTYIDDIIDGVMAAIDYTDSLYEIINLGNNRTVQLLELVEAIEEASGIEPNRTHGPEIPGDVKQTWADVSKAKKLLGYSPNYDLEKGLANFAEWYKEFNITSVSDLDYQ